MALHSAIAFAGLHKAKIDGGLLIDRPAAPEGFGDMYWATDDDGGVGAIYLSNAAGNTWVKFSIAASNINLDDLGDVDAAAPTNGQVLTWNNGTSAWEAATPSAASDASAVTYTPAVVTDWNGSVDPGNADDAFDQLASRTKTIETAEGKLYAASGDATLDFLDQKLVAGSNITLTVSGTTDKIITVAATTGVSGLDDLRELAIARW